MDYIKTTWGSNIFGIPDDHEFTDEERRWDKLLRDYGFGELDEFDLKLLEGIERGFFDGTAIVAEAKKHDLRIKATNAYGKLQAAWQRFHGSFADNADEVVDAVDGAVRENVQFVSPLHLNGAIVLLKELGYQERASQLLEFYLANRDEAREFYDLTRDSFGGDVTDPDIRASFDEKLSSFEKEEFNPAETLLNIYERRGWGARQIANLAKLTADDFYQLFKNYDGEDLDLLVTSSIQFENNNGVGDSERAISARAKEALVRIGKESPINKQRVERKYKIKLDG